MDNTHPESSSDLGALAEELAVLGYDINDDADMDRMLSERPDLAKRVTEAISANVPPAVFDLLEEMEKAGFDISDQRDLNRMAAERPELAARLAEAMAPYTPPLLQILIDFLETENWADSQRYLEAHPELLGDETDDLLVQMLQTAEARNEEDAIIDLENHRILLARVKELGITAAYEELERETDRFEEEMEEGVGALIAAVRALPEEQQQALLQVFATTESPDEAMAELMDRDELAQIIRGVMGDVFTQVDNE
jgi:hypothetical protein